MAKGDNRIWVAAALHVLLSAVLVACDSGSSSGGFVGSFDHGVQSGDPLSDRVIIWTRVTPRQRDAEVIPVVWRVSRSAQSHLDGGPFDQTGTFQASAASDWTVKVDVDKLSSGQVYFYSFAAGPAESPLGRFKVPFAPDTLMSQLRYAVFSCANWGWGYFNAYDLASKQDLDFWLHLGDFIYEYGPDNYPAPHQAVRFGPSAEAGQSRLEPAAELLALAHYRQRYAHYRSDPGLLALSAAAPLIAVWDDHEIANNPWSDPFPGGAQNHNAGEGPWAERARAAVQAYHEWLPTRVDSLRGDFRQKIYRKFAFGNLALLLMLETRLSNRTNGEEDPFPLSDEDGDGDPANDAPSAAVRAKVKALIQGRAPSQWASPPVALGMGEVREAVEAYRRREGKQLLGAEQLEWVRAEVRAAAAGGARWQLVGQQTVLSDMQLGLEEAIADARKRGEGERAAGWEELLSNLTDAQCPSTANCPPPAARLQARLTDPTAYSAEHYNTFQAISGAAVEEARATLAMGRFKVPDYFDSWEGYVAERTRFLSALSHAGGAAVVYGGDSHNAWAAEHRDASGGAVCAEYDGTSVTSTGKENFNPMMEPEFQAAAYVAGNARVDEGQGFEGSLKYAEVSMRGFVLVELTPEEHHGEFVFLDTVASTRYKVAKCDAFDYAKRHGASQHLEKGRCRALSHAGKPYESEGRLHASLCQCHPGACVHGCERAEPEDVCIEDFIVVMTQGNVSSMAVLSVLLVLLILLSTVLFLLLKQARRKLQTVPHSDTFGDESAAFL